MSKHLRALGKLKKNVLGLSTANLDTEITSLGQRRDKLPTLIYEKTDESAAAEVLANMVDKYHLKEASLIKKEVKDKLTGNITTTLNFPSSMELTTFINTINEELSAKCETQIVIDSAKKRAEGFFSVKTGREPISGIDGDTISSITNYQRFNDNAYNYTESSMYLHFINLVEKGDLKLEFEVTNPHFNILSYTYTLTSELGSKEKLVTSKGTPDGAINNEKGNILIVKSDKENVYNVFTNLSATGTPVTTTTYDLNTESFSKIELVDEKGGKTSFSLTFEKNDFIGKELKLATEKSFEVVERLVLAYRDTYIKNYMEYLPDFAQLKYFLTQNMEDVFGKYVSRVFEGEFGGEEDLDNEKLKSKFTYFTNEIIDTLSSLFYGDLSKSKRIDTIERYRKNISIAVLNLGKQNDNSKNILSTFGESVFFIEIDGIRVKVGGVSFYSIYSWFIRDLCTRGMKDLTCLNSLYSP